MSQKLKTPALAATRQPGQIGMRNGRKANSSGNTCQCPRCGFLASAPLFRPGWLDKLQQLAARYSGMGFGPDLAALTLIELHGLYLRLMKLGN